ncbi:hypothetical protein C4D60_Mb00t09330 [Musa balbisiana]|uniref:Small ribosomal subunit protein uS3c n=1 Tax=Musa balbisiana TaxID=52838 RepID=A0A4S8I4N3_MUSBA|nr:hypothetical protein C4D60_Mb00t09330 [Musa balbisiana]
MPIFKIKNVKKRSNTLSYNNCIKGSKILAQHICSMSVFKARRVIDQIRGRSYEETLMILELMPYRASYPILKLVYSAAANASHNMGLNEADSFISEAKVNRSTIVKKLRPRARGQGQTRGIEELQMNVQKEFNSVNRRLNIAITRVEKPYGQPNILAEYIALQLKNRVSFRKAMKKAIELAEQTDTKGMQVQIAGRIDGKEIARVEWIREGRVPLQTIRAKIDHCSYTIRTIYGVLGIKIWIFVDEE